MKCFECPFMAYALFDEGTYAVRWCDKRGTKCSEAWPKDCPYVQSETRYAEAVKAYNKRYSTGIEEYYAWRKKTGKEADIAESAAYAKKFAGPVPKTEEF
jgi:hypothetical protein